MTDFFKYFPVSREEQKWGIWVLNSGCTQIPPRMNYPNTDHPSPYDFEWKNGRVLQEYQLVYITQGTGVFESDKAGLKQVKAGSVVLLFPHERHRYRPDWNTGWNEFWIGFDGEIVQNLVSAGFFKPEAPVCDLGYNERIMGIFDEIIEKSKEEKPGFQGILSGAALHLLGQISSAVQQKDIADDENLTTLIDKARLIFRTNIESKISPEDIARELNVGYSYFRKAFKAYVGIPPGQYLIQLRIQKAKELLAGSNRSIKQVAIDLNFDSSFYFSKLFKEKTGISPARYRKLTGS